MACVSPALVFVTNAYSMLQLYIILTGIYLVIVKAFVTFV